MHNLRFAPRGAGWSVLALAMLFTLWLLAGSIRAGEPTADATPSEATASPKIADDRLQIELFAEAPQITTPVSLATYGEDRVLVIASHTHFRPDDYSGPETDRVRLLQDTTGDGRADEVTTFTSGFTHAMDITTGRDGWIYLATRRAIHRFRDADGDDRAEERQRIVQLKTEGQYPHNGLSGLAFNFAGVLHFGLGENLGKPYTLIGSDGKQFRGGGEGGSAYRCRADGSHLQRIATGFWNPFGMEFDRFGRLFATDNDPGSSPPNRLLHVVPGADFGYQYQYGRSGLHPFIAWDGQLPGTLGMVTGIGEASCEILAYESDGLPGDYRGDLLTASWADHRLERYRLEENGATFTARRIPFVSGGLQFRPVGLDVGRDGSLFISDWMVGTYSTHHQGRIWHISWPKAEPDRPKKPRKAVFAVDRHTRQQAARKLSKTAKGQQLLREICSSAEDAAVRATALKALVTRKDRHVDFRTLATDDPAIGIRLIAVRASKAAGPLLDEVEHAELQAAILRQLDPVPSQDVLLSYLSRDDPYLRQAASYALSRKPQALLDLDWQKLDEPRQRLGVLLALKWSDLPKARQSLNDFLADPNPKVQYAALKWIADEHLQDYRQQLTADLDSPRLTLKLLRGYVAALERLKRDKNRRVDDLPNGRLLLRKAADEQVPTETRRRALALLRSEQVKLKQLQPFFGNPHRGIRKEAVRLLAGSENPKRFPLLARIAADAKETAIIRAEALVGLAPDAGDHVGLLMNLATGANPTLRAEALRALIGVELAEQHRKALRDSASRRPTMAQAVGRVLDQYQPSRPEPSQIDAWLALLEEPGDPQAGRRIFFHPKVGMCIRCHSFGSRGNRLGPDLSRIDHPQPRRWLLESILQPSREIAPQYTPWTIITTDGKTHTGFALRKGGQREVYVDETGEEFVLQKENIANFRQMQTSLMPKDLVETITNQELRDLMAFLTNDEE